MPVFRLWSRIYDLIFHKVAVLLTVVPTGLSKPCLITVWCFLLACLIFHRLYPHTLMTFIQQRGTNVHLTHFHNMWIRMNM